MPTAVYSDASDGYLLSSDTTGDYSAARAGTGDQGIPVTDTTHDMTVGQTNATLNYDVYESFMNFDLAAAGVTAVTAATLSLWISTDISVTDFNIEVRANDWGATLTTADWVPGASLSGKTLLCSLTTSGIATGAYVVITEQGTALKDAITAALAGDGVLRVVVCSSRTTAGTTPTGDELIAFKSADATGTANDPKLDVTVTTAGGVHYYQRLIAGC